MSTDRHTVATRFVVMATLVTFMIAQHPRVFSSEALAQSAATAETPVSKAKTAVKHKPLKHFVPGHRIRVEAKVTDPRKVSLVRCYFRASGQASYVFVQMMEGETDLFTGILPAPGAETSGIEYLFLTVNGKNQVVKTQVFRAERKATDKVPDWQRASAEGSVTVSTELAEASAPAGFTDSISADAVESAARFGFVAGLYSAAEMAAAGSAGAAVGGAAAAAGGATGAATGSAAGGAVGGAATATSGGTVSASTGLSTGAVVGVTAAAVAVVAVGAVGVSSVADAGGSTQCSDYFAGCTNGQSIKACCDNSSCWYDIGGRIFTCNSRSDCYSAADAAVRYCTGRSVGTRGVDDYQAGPLSVEQLLFSTGGLRFR